jgi:3-oxoacyl-[acyl-carrier-protein] synthase II
MTDFQDTTFQDTASQDTDPIVITGLGASTPLGGDVSSTWEALLAGRSGARVIDEPWADQLPVRIAAPAAVDPAEVLGRVGARKLDRSQQLAIVAAREAWADAGTPDVEPDRLAVVLASGIGGVTTLLAAADTLTEKGARAVGPHTVPMLMPNGPAAVVALELGARAQVSSPVSACASGAESIAMALDLLRLGRADVVVCGGTEAAIHPLPLAGFASMRALSLRNDEPEAASRPFDKGRDGFVLGEGAGVLVLERASSATRRGVRVYAELAGAGITSDAHHIAAPDPVGAGAGRAVSLAMRDAGAVPTDVVHINPHATSTPLGDLAEVSALRSALGEVAGTVPVSATKSATGHLLGAAGGLEALLTVLALDHRIAPPTRNLDDQDDEAILDVVRFEGRRLPPNGVGLSTSFGFGGHNVALAFRTASVSPTASDSQTAEPRT